MGVRFEEVHVEKEVRCKKNARRSRQPMTEIHGQLDSSDAILPYSTNLRGTRLACSRRTTFSGSV